MSLNVPQLNLDVFLPLVVLLSYTAADSASAAAAAPTADKEDQYLQLLSGVATH